MYFCIQTIIKDSIFRSKTPDRKMMAPEYSHYMEPEKNSIPSKNSRCFDFWFPKRFCHCCCCSIQVGLIQSQVFFLLCGIFSIVIGYLHTANMVMGSIMIVLAVMALFATVWKSCILAPLGITIAVIGIVNTVSTTNLSLMSLVAHWFGRVEFQIFVLIFFNYNCL